MLLVLVSFISCLGGCTGEMGAYFVQSSVFDGILGGTVKISSEDTTNALTRVHEQVYNVKKTLNISNTAFTNCKYSMDGGAIHSSLSDTFITGCIFYKNSALSSGGAIRVEKCTITNISFTSFGYNYADHFGGACCFSVVFTVDMSFTNFSDNFAERYTGASGFVMCDVVSMSDVIDYKSESRLFGSVSIDNGDSDLMAVTFLSTLAPTSVYGAKFSTASLYQCDFFNKSTSYISWNSLFQLEVVECNFDLPQVNAISSHKLVTCENCEFSVESDQHQHHYLIPSIHDYEKRASSQSIKPSREKVKKPQFAYSQILPGLDRYEETTPSAYSVVLCCVLFIFRRSVNCRTSKQSRFAWDRSDYVPGNEAYSP